MEEKMIKKERLFWWNEKYFHMHEKENYGDVLGKYLFEKITNKKVVFSLPKKWSYRDLFKQPIYFTVGSILANVNYFTLKQINFLLTKELIFKYRDYKYLYTINNSLNELSLIIKKD